MEGHGAWFAHLACRVSRSQLSQRWPGHVKARHFVLALRDYYRQKAENKNEQVGEDDLSTLALADHDRWALEWINVNRLQAIAEAFDDDGSGFITIAEVNKLTTSRPKDWRSVV